jgi:hypothetical protein
VNKRIDRSKKVQFERKQSNTLDFVREVTALPLFCWFFCLYVKEVVFVICASTADFFCPQKISCPLSDLLLQKSNRKFDVRISHLQKINMKKKTNVNECFLLERNANYKLFIQKKNVTKHKNWKRPSVRVPS